MPIVLPEFLTSQSPDVIRERMLSRVPGKWDNSEGSFTWDMLTCVSLELSVWADWAQLFLFYSFVQSTYGPYLDARAEEHGLSRHPAEFAFGDLLLTGTSGVFVPSGWLVSTPSGGGRNATFFLTIAFGNIGSDGTLSLPVRALDPGVLGNVATGTILIPVNRIEGVASVENPLPTAGGTEIEADESLRNRIFDKVREDPGDGNVDDYERWVKDFSGVATVNVLPWSPDVGYVRLYITSPGGIRPTDALVTQVWDFLDPFHPTLETPLGTLAEVQAARVAFPDWGKGYGRATIGHCTILSGPYVVRIVVEVLGLSIEEGYTFAGVATGLRNAVAAYINSVESGDVVRYNDVVASAIRTPGSRDFTALSLVTGLDVGGEPIRVVGNVATTPGEKALAAGAVVTTATDVASLKYLGVHASGVTVSHSAMAGVRTVTSSVSGGTTLSAALTGGTAMP